MAKRSSKIDVNKILKNYNFKGSKQLQNTAYRAAVKKAKEVKKEVLKEFNKHEVTKEIEQGPKGRSSSLLGGTGNFFGFLGFEKGSKPVAILREALDASFTVNKQRGRLKKVSKNVFTVEFDVLLPTDEQLYSLTPLPWTTKSWIKGVEKGITNYTQTVFQERKGRGTLFDSHSRSGVAIQVKRQVNFVKFSSTPYITSILDKARKILK
tara:strand:+ start:965 stop:1591 length:627 start_codon:yes stop_codon:yes gene_type:complete